MKKYYYWPIIAGILGGFISSDPCGLISGSVFGVIVGIPLYYLLAYILKLITRQEKKRNDIVAVCLSCCVMIISQWLIIQPPAIFVFKSKIANPIPSSVKNIKAKTIYIGPDGPSGTKFLKFNVSKSDFEKIIKDKNFKTELIVIDKIKNEIYVELIPPNDLIRFSLPNWFNLNHSETLEAYAIIDNRDESWVTYEYIIYDPITEEAIYESSVR